MLHAASFRRFLMKFILYFLLLTGTPAWAGQLTGDSAPAPIEGMPSDIRSSGSVGASGGASLADAADFRAAQEAFRNNDAAKLERIAQRLKKTPLDVYVRYYQLRMDLGTADPMLVAGFLARSEDTPMIDRLRGEWLKLLGKEQRWELFDAEYPRLLNEDTELACYALQSRRRSQEQAALREVRGLWLNGKDQPESCSVLFESALSANIISEQDILRRLRMALEAGNVSLAQKLAERLGGSYAELSLAFKNAFSDPDRFLDKLALQNADYGQRMVALFALQRLAKLSPSLAAGRWANISAYFPATEQQYYFGWLAYEAARNHDGRALQWYREAATTPLNENQSAWRVRAALRAQDWPEVSDSISAMNSQQQREAAWVYWKARALLELGKPVEARNQLAMLSGEIHFYGQLAGDELSDSPVLSEPVAPYQPDQHALDAMMELPGVQRTLALYRAGAFSEALEEWRWLLRNFNDRELLTAAEIARRNKMYDRAIGAADRTVSVHDFSLRYLAPYRDVLKKHIREHGLEEAWVYGLMRQESRFASSAKSDVGAAGLMQIMPATARWVAEKLGLKRYHDNLIHQHDTNLRLGTYYMKAILSQFGGNPVLASAAYNAGPRRAEEWRGDQPLEGAIYAETIPFEETRDYVKKVMSNTVYYAVQFNAPRRSLKQRMGVVAPKAADSQAISLR
jgi:soluble lytic murein transglycosylase